MLLMSFVSNPSAQEVRQQLQIRGYPVDPRLQVIVGNAWALYLNGEIDLNSGERLEKFIKQNNVPAESWAFLNSPGGSLYGGMALGSIIRKYRLRTDVAVLKGNATNAFNSDPGDCYSACTLSYVGGTFRFLHQGSHFGIHRFAFSSPQKQEMDVAQVASATIVGYLRSMDIDTDLFTLSTTAGPDEIYEPSIEELKKLNVVTNGFNRPRWSIESNNGILYLKGERDTVYGINKFLLFCPPQSGMVLHVIFDAQRRDRELTNFPAHSLLIDHQEYPIVSGWRQMTNGWFNSEYVLNDEELRAIANASSVGLIVRSSYGAPIFLGFDDMPFEDGAKKLVGLLNSCNFSH
jgi:hypothetical protein